jgi:hypothetical protein
MDDEKSARRALSAQLVAYFCIFELKTDCVVKSMAYKHIGQDVKEN